MFGRLSLECVKGAILAALCRLSMRRHNVESCSVLQSAVAAAEAVGSVVARDEIVSRLRHTRSSSIGADDNDAPQFLTLEQLKTLFAFRVFAARIASLEGLVCCRCTGGRGLGDRQAC